MRVLFVGDIMGGPGRDALKHFLPRLREEWHPDFVMANAENSAGGKGITGPVSEEVFGAGVDVITMGNHTWARKGVDPLLKDERVLRPANYPPVLPGHGYAVFSVKGKSLGVLQLMGRHRMAEIDCPFRKADEILNEWKADVIVVDMHAEASSEKQAMGWYLDGRVSAVVGTHIHVQTADERLLPQGTAFISDVGMTGPRDSIIGGDREVSLKRFLTGLPAGVAVEKKGDLQVSACVLDVDENTGKAIDIQRVYRVLKKS